MGRRQLLGRTDHLVECTHNLGHAGVDHVHFGLGVQARDHCIQPGGQAQVVQGLCLLPDGVLCIDLCTVDVAFLNGFLHL